MKRKNDRIPYHLPFAGEREVRDTRRATIHQTRRTAFLLTFLATSVDVARRPPGVLVHGACADWPEAHTRCQFEG